MNELSSLVRNTVLGYLAIIMAFIFFSKEKKYSYIILFIFRVLPVFSLVVISIYFLSEKSSLIIMCGIINMLTFPLFYYLKNHKENVTFNFPYDFAFGLYIVAFLTSFQIIGQNFMPNNFVVITINFLEIMLLVIPVLEIIYFVYYGENISFYAFLAILGTDRKEVREYFKNIHIVKLLLGLLLPTSLFALIIYANNFFVHSSRISNTMVGVFLAIMLFSGYYLFIGSKALYKRIGIFVIYKDSVDYYAKSKDYNLNYEVKYKKLEVKSNLKAKEKKTILLVIGESANRLHMSAFSDYERETTPWLSAQKSNPDFFLLSNAYSTWSQTVPTLEMALTEKNQYNNKKFEHSYSFIDMARKIGLKTWWYSNQGYIGKDDTPITLVAKTSDEARWILQDYSVVQYDGKLLDYLKKVDMKQDNLVVMHLKGSHSNFYNRYPEKFNKWKDSGKEKLRAEYDNSILYTDSVLEEIYNYARSNLNLQAMVYFSDHGIEVKKKRMPGFVGFENLRIPFFVFLAKEYREKYPETTNVLENNNEAYFTNDLIYDLMCGILQIKSVNYNAGNDISSPLYSYNQSSLRTNLGKTSLAEDIYKRNFES